MAPGTEDSFSPKNKPAVRQVYSLIVATAFLDMASDVGRNVVEQIHSFASQRLSESNAAFRDLVSQVDGESSPSVVGTGMAAPEEFAAAFLGWLKARGVPLDDIGPLVDKQVFPFAGDAKDPQSGLPFSWCLFVYFDLSS